MNELLTAIYIFVASLCPLDQYFYCDVEGDTEDVIEVRLYHRIPTHHDENPVYRTEMMNGRPVRFRLDYRQPKRGF